MKSPIIPILAVLLSILPLTAQEAFETAPGRLEVPPAPVVSGITASLTENKVLISWDTPPSTIAESTILRDTKPITASTFRSAQRRGTVNRDVTTYTDILESPGSYYYAVLSFGSDGKAFDFFLPANNATLIAVSLAAPAEAVSVRITAFTSLVRNDAVIVTWKTDFKGTGLVLYRSTTPFSDMTSLAGAIVLSSFDETGTPYVDYPVPGVPYYYAILDESSVLSGNVSFVADENTNRVPVEVSSGYAKFQKVGVPPVRPMPLPWLNPSSKLERPPYRFTRETEAMISSMTSKPGILREVPYRAYLFEIDTLASGAGEEFTLRKILESSFIPGKWDVAITELGRFLSIRRSSEVTARAHFYLGQAKFFSGSYSEALLEFLLVQDRYHVQARAWIHYVMERLSSDRRSITG